MTMATVAVVGRRQVPVEFSRMHEKFFDSELSAYAYVVLVGLCFFDSLRERCELQLLEGETERSLRSVEVAIRTLGR